jgi:starch synthase
VKVLFVATEAAPLAKVGGMGDVVGTLPGILKDMGHDVRVLMPYYGFLPKKLQVPPTAIWTGDVMLQEVEVYETRFPNVNIPLYLLGHWAFATNEIYGGEGEDWRFTLFANGATEFIKNYWKPDVVHCHDWHTGMIPVWLAEEEAVATVFTIHNLAYQGPWQGRLREITWCPDDMKGHNTLSAALYYADQVNAVSPTYAKQIQTPEYGENLEEILTSIDDKLQGIVNGIDMDRYNPATDTAIAQTYDAQTLDRRLQDKTVLQGEVGLTVDPDKFLVGVVSRLVEQKGIDIILPAVDRFLQTTDAQLVVLGTGDKPYEEGLTLLAAQYPERMAVKLLYSDPLSRRIYAGTDAFLMPSRFEPCGISQMFALRYGSVPIVRHTGGLVDTVSDHDPIRSTGTGYCFEPYDPYALLGCMMRSWEGFKYRKEWQALQQRGMAVDFSWTLSAKEYVKVYERAIEHKRETLELQSNSSL